MEEPGEGPPQKTVNAHHKYVNVVFVPLVHWVNRENLVSRSAGINLQLAPP